MLFNSYAFIFGFLPLALMGFFAIGRFRAAAAAAWLAGMSLVFYGWWNWRLVFLLAGSVAFNFAGGRLLGDLRERGAGVAMHRALVAAIAANLILLGYFKYIGFFASVAGDALGLNLHVAPVVLPIGISFFTFTQIAYLVDTARGLAGRSGAGRNGAGHIGAGRTGVVHYLLFVTYFPHLIAGPILHHAEMLPQFRDRRIYRPDSEALAVGLTMFLFGLFKKTVLADRLAPLSDHGFAPGHVATLGMGAAWIAALGYTLQIYLDFSAYSDMAIGLSRLFNIRLPANFESPYKARSIIDFWHRWHMTLSRFLRDYLYFSLGGKRRGPARRYANLMATMLLGGLWHGAGWTYVAWGGLHGGYLIANHLWRGLRRRHGRPAGAAERLMGWGLTLLCVIVAWVVFRAPDMASAGRVLAGMAGLHGPGVMPAEPDIALLAGLGAMVLFAPNLRQIVGHDIVAAPDGAERAAAGFRWPHWQPNLLWGGACLGLLALALLQMTSVSPFLYFQF